MEALNTSLATYAITIVISIFVALLVQLMVTVLHRFAKPEKALQSAEPIEIEAPEASESEAEVALAIFIAKNH